MHLSWFPYDQRSISEPGATPEKSQLRAWRMATIIVWALIQYKDVVLPVMEIPLGR